jgi:hypothetical protein
MDDPRHKRRTHLLQRFEIGFDLSTARALWKCGKDTKQIAIELNVPECAVYNKLESILIE